MYQKITACIMALLLLSGCSRIPPAASTAPSKATSSTTTSTETSATAETTVASETTVVTDAATETTEVTQVTEETTAPTETTAETEPAHSQLYLPYVSVDEMITYFNEVCLDAEFSNNGDATVLQRWEHPIYYQVYGDPTDKDLEVLSRMCQWLNNVEGFPGIYETTATWQENFSIYFCSQSELIDRMGDGYYGLDGAFTFWYSDNIIYDCTICIRTDLDQELRNSVIQEEIYNSLGPAQDTDLRAESLIYSGFSLPQAMHPIDEVILQLLYHPSLSCGMSAADCAPLIAALYY